MYPFEGVAFPPLGKGEPEMAANQTTWEVSRERIGTMLQSGWARFS